MKKRLLNRLEKRLESKAQAKPKLSLQEVAKKEAKAVAGALPWWVCSDFAYGIPAHMTKHCTASALCHQSRPTAVALQAGGFARHSSCGRWILLAPGSIWPPALELQRCSGWAGLCCPTCLPWWVCPCHCAATRVCTILTACMCSVAHHVPSLVYVCHNMQLFTA